MAPYPGRIFINPNFMFSDGTSKPKFFVVLTTCPVNPDNALIAITTSKPKSEPVKGCYNNTQFPSYYIPADENCIDGQSWLMLGEVFSVSWALVKVKCTHVGDLGYEITKEILACAAGSERIERIYKQSILDHSASLK